MIEPKQDVSQEQAQIDALEEKTENSSTQSPLKTATTPDNPSFGWSFYAERVNGRFAMIGFASVLLIEALSNDSFLHWAGLIP